MDVGCKALFFLNLNVNDLEQEVLVVLIPS
jgi:hypothetical protein